MRDIEIGGRRARYVEMGAGPVILFVHGLGAMWQCWLEQLPEFARDHRVVAVDLPGFGRSEMPDWEITMEGYGAWMGEFAAAVGISAATVVGNSMGGFVGAEIAIKSPELVERLSLVSAAIFWQEYRRAKPLVALARVTEGTAARATAGFARAAGNMRPRLRHTALALAGIRYPHLLSREMQAELLRTARRTDAFVPALAAFGDYPLREELPRVKAPTLVLWGAQDTLVGVRHAHELARLIPNSETVIFERTGHVPMVERPERFNRVLRDWMAKTDPFTGHADVFESISV